MNVLILLPNDSLGGAEQYLKMLAKYHKKDKVEVFFLKATGDKLWEDLPNSILLKHLDKSSFVMGLYKLFTTLALRKTKEYDRIYTSHIFITGIVGLLITLGLLKKKQFVARESTSAFTRFKGLKLFKYKLAYRFGYRHIDLLICQTGFMKKQLVEGFTAIQKRTKITVLENPIDIALIQTKENGSFEFIPPKKFIISAGRLITEKGFDVFIEAFSAIALDFPRTEVVILGDGPEKEKLLSLVKSHQLQGRVHLPGRMKNVYPYFKAACLCVVSSRIEGFPNVLLQMMSQNSSIVSTRCAGGIEDIPNIITLFPEDAKALAKSMRLALNSDTLRNRAVFDNYLKNRDISSFIKKMELVLERVNHQFQSGTNL